MNTDFSFCLLVSSFDAAQSLHRASIVKNKNLCQSVFIRVPFLQVPEGVLEEPQPQQPPLAAMDAGVLPVKNVIFGMGH
jgi:hypothetical protein